jgi:protein TonB
LGVYGVLHAEEIYTIYLPMPGKNWILQYCAHDDSPKMTPLTRLVQMRAEPLLTPPRVLDQFDFHRPPADQAPADATIILHGLIRADGTVGNVEVLQGLDPTLDGAAVAAFARWKFSPALRGGSPVAVEILVGIPAVGPEG